MPNSKHSRHRYVPTISSLRLTLIFAPQRQGTTQTSQSAIDKETDAKLEEITRFFEQNKDAVVEKLIDRVTVVKAEVHRNLKKVERS